eukprot:295520-Rhodomonas_salina.2
MTRKPWKRLKKSLLILPGLLTSSPWPRLVRVRKGVGPGTTMIYVRTRRRGDQSLRTQATCKRMLSLLSLHLMLEYTLAQDNSVSDEVLLTTRSRHHSAVSEEVVEQQCQDRTEHCIYSINAGP